MDVENLVVGAGLRFAQSLIQAAPTLLIGLIVAGVFRRLLGHAATLRLFGGNSWRSLPQAWLLGMLLPICSLGAIPVLRELRRAGLSGGAILAFGLTAPLFNPISILYGLTLADPVVILTFSFCSLVIVTVVGLAWDKLFPGTAQPDPEDPPVSYGAKRMLSIAVFAARDLGSPTLRYLLIGLLGVGLLSMVLPYGYLQRAAEPQDLGAPLLMTAVAIPAYATPMTAIVQLASMFQHGNSVGAAFALLVLGAGANLGLCAWMAWNYGPRRTAAWFALLVGIVIALAYGVNAPLYPHGVEPAGHTHAFDIYCTPFHFNTQDPLRAAVTALKEKSSLHELVALAAVGGLLLLGVALKVTDRSGGLNRWLHKQSESKPRVDFVLPGSVLGATALVALVGLSAFGCYIYYPPPSEVLEEMESVNIEVVSAALAGDWDTALYWIPIYDDWTRKLQVSMVLRGRELTRYRRAKSNVLRDKLELLEHKVEDQEVTDSRDLAMAVTYAYRRMRAAY